MTRPLVFSAATLERDDAGKWKKPATLGGYSLATFRGDQRARDNVEAVSALTIDYDGTAPSLDAVRVFWGLARGVVFSSFNGAPRCRVHLLLSRDVMRDEHDVLWAWAARRSASMPVDPAARDASRFWFAPAHVDGTEFCIEDLEGEPLDVDALLAEERQREEAPRRPSPLRLGHGGAKYARAALLRALERLESAPRGGRNSALNREAFSLGRFVAAGELDEQLVVDALIDTALAVGLHKTEAVKTVASGLRSGMRRAG